MASLCVPTERSGYNELVVRRFGIGLDRNRASELKARIQGLTATHSVTQHGDRLIVNYGIGKLVELVQGIVRLLEDFGVPYMLTKDLRRYASL